MNTIARVALEMYEYMKGDVKRINDVYNKIFRTQTGKKIMRCLFGAKEI